MESRKFMLRSKTVVSGLVALALMIAPQLGVSFSEEDASLINGNWDVIATGLATFATIFFQVFMKSPETLTLLPKSGSSTVKSPWVVGVLAMLLMACVPASIGDTPKEKLLVVEETYVVYLRQAELYWVRPFCPTPGVPCAEPDVVIAMKTANDSVQGALDVARVTTTDSTVGNVQFAMSALTTILLATQGN